MTVNTESLVQGVCKDCGNGTLNNYLVPAFEEIVNDVDDVEFRCNRCGSDHLDLVVL